MPGLEKLLRGVVRYRKEVRPKILEQFEKIRDSKPEPKALVFSCVDSRVLVTKLLNNDVGDMFLVRNAGAMIPNCKVFHKNDMSTEPAVMELACVTNKVRNIIVVGHSDCKAMNALYGMRDQMNTDTDSPLQQWLQRHGTFTVNGFEKFKSAGEDKPIEFHLGDRKHFKAYIDPDNKFGITDKFSQLNTLMQVQNIGSYKMLHPGINSGDLSVHAMWFDVYDGEFYLFSRSEERFTILTEDNFDRLVKEAEMPIVAT